MDRADAGEVCADPATVASGCIAKTTTMAGAPFGLPVNPAQVDQQHVVLSGAPEHGLHTEKFLMDAGIYWGRIQQLNDDRTILIAFRGLEAFTPERISVTSVLSMTMGVS